ncbi:MAG: aspartate--tRNA ligase [Candidatus Nanohaloarchaeota archaeon QJJ-7]|nr:aspartate--tRNA ligase [Candidatus Nanohaloarchaeota archaeon QJJ-7]
MERTHRCGDMRGDDTGEDVVLKGWVHRVRDHGGKRFVDLRDREGIVQVVLSPEETERFHESEDLGREYLLEVEGEMQERPEGTVNEDMDTGKVEVSASSFDVISESETPPFSLDNEKTDEAREELRFEHRYLDLRRPRVAENMKKRHEFFHAARNFLAENEFVEVETPYLTKSTPEGARDFVVPSRNFGGNFYALPQSPQLFKQLLMVGGMDRYYQVVKCFRDEDTRKDRQPEFTQLDLEVSFMEQDEFLQMMGDLLATAFEDAFGEEFETPVERITWQEAMDNWGSDRPDRRYGMKLHNVSSIVEGSELNIFARTVEEGGVVKGFRLEGRAGELSNNDMDDLIDYAEEEGAGGLIWVKLTGEGFESPVEDYLETETLRELIDEFDAEAGDVLFFVADEKPVANEVLGSLRRHLADNVFDLAEEAEGYELLWITDFPMFSYEDGEFGSEHHPFTMPREPEKLREADSDDEDALLQLDADAYDIVLNGYEIGGGSKRIHDPELQQKVFDVLGLSEEEVEERFGWFVDAFQYGAPPHRGIAFGADRIFMVFQDEPNIREVIPFPKSKQGHDYLTDAPSPPREDQLEGLGIEVIETEDE